MLRHHHPIIKGMCKSLLHNKIYFLIATIINFNLRFIFIFSSREEMCRSLTNLGISCTVILDSAVGYVMEQVDMVMVGAEGVAESGGVINKVCNDSK